MPAMGSATSAWTPSRNAADPPIADQMTGTIERLRDRGVASINAPAVKIVVGHGRPNVGIRSRLRWSIALIKGYANEYAIRPHATGAHALPHGAKDKRRRTTPTRKKRTAWLRKSAAKSHAAGLMRVKNAT
jgi:hypothetical protein